MSFTRLPFDTCAYKHSLLESIGSCDYMLDRNAPCKPCFVPDPSINVQRNGAALCPNLIDVDSELLGLTRKASHCPSKQYLPSDKAYCGAVPSDECNDLRAEHCRISNPSCTLRCTGWNRFEYLCKNPQDKVEIPFEWNINNRLVVKDAHRPCKPKPISQTLALPPQIDQQPPLFCGTLREPNPLNFRTCHELKHL